MTQETNKAATETVANVNAADFGKQAISKWNTRDKSGAQGDALGFKAVMLAYETMSFTAIWKEKEDGVDRAHRHDFDLKEYMTKEMKNANGSRNNKATKARTEAIMFKVFGVEDASPAQLQSLRRCVEMAKNFIANGYTSDDVKITSRGYLEIPYKLMHDEPKADASDRDLKTWEKNKDDTETLDGINGMSITKFAQRIKPETTRAAQSPSTPADASQSFLTAIKYASSVLEAMTDEKGESNLAPNEPMRQEMHDLLVRLNKYFKADPLEVMQKKSA